MTEHPICKVIFGDQVIIDLTRDTVQQSSVLATKTFHLPTGEIVEGTMPNNEAQHDTIETLNEIITIQPGYHNGFGTITINTEEKNKLIPANIREDITVLGIHGTMSPLEGIKSTQVTITPTLFKQIITPEELGNFNSINEINVNPITYTEVDNEWGGKTAIIGSVG